MMPDLNTTAFGHPVDRNISDDMAAADRISLRDFIIGVEIGAFQAERDVVQRLRFNVAVELKNRTADTDDDVDSILSYDKLIEAIQDELKSGRKDLLETVADNVAMRILAEPQADNVIVRVEKIDRVPGALGVEIVRSTKDYEQAEIALEVPQPTIVVFPRSAVATAGITPWIDAALDHSRPVIFCVAFDSLGDPQAQQTVPQRRIDLLTIEQACWHLNAHDNRCFVVDSKTELDWGLKNNQLSVWAPSRLIWNSMTAPEYAREDIANYIGWFADLMKAERVVVVDHPGFDCPIATEHAEIDHVTL